MKYCALGLCSVTVCFLLQFWPTMGQTAIASAYCGGKKDVVIAVHYKSFTKSDYIYRVRPALYAMAKKFPLSRWCFHAGLHGESKMLSVYSGYSESALTLAINRMGFPTSPASQRLSMRDLAFKSYYMLKDFDRYASRKPVPNYIILLSASSSNVAIGGVKIKKINPRGKSASYVASLAYNFIKGYASVVPASAA